MANNENAVAVDARLITASTASPPSRTTRLARLRRALKFAFPYRRAVLAILAVTLVMAAISAAEPLILKYLFDGLVSTGQTRTLITAICILVAFGIFREIAN